MDKELLDTCPIPNGILVIIGGHENKGKAAGEKPKNGNDKPLEILKNFVALAKQKESCIIEVCTSASSDGLDTFKEYKECFEQLGVKEVGHIHHDARKEVLNDTGIEKRLSKADGIFFSGGDQLKLTSLYGGSQLLLILKQRYISDKLVVAGTSAGAMAFSTPMIFAGNKDVQQIAGEVKITTGMEFLKDVCIDTHFVDRSRFVRMGQVLATNPTSIGIGIEEDTAVIIRNGKNAEVIGSGVVIVMEGFGITDSNILDFGLEKRIFIHDLNVKLLAKGSRYTIPGVNPPHL
jgi:cyanophycinase